MAQAGKRGTVTIATNTAGRGTDIKLPQEVKDAGGLAIIGTERQREPPRGPSAPWPCRPSGRPGSSVFFVSFEDTVMRLFANERIVKTLDRLGFEEGDMIESKMVTRSIENASEARRGEQLRHPQASRGIRRCH